MPRTNPFGIALLVAAAAWMVAAGELWAQSAPGASAAVPATPSSIPGTPAPSAISVPVPARGLLMDQVEARFGVPDTKLPAVGDPPITRWVYPEFTVYFEGRYVIHAVINQ